MPTTATNFFLAAMDLNGDPDIRVRVQRVIATLRMGAEGGEAAAQRIYDRMVVERYYAPSSARWPLRSAPL
jgi:hypothetical protein